MMTVPPQGFLNGAILEPPGTLRRLLSMLPALGRFGPRLFGAAMFGLAFGAFTFLELSFSVAACEACVAEGEKLVGAHWLVCVGAHTAVFAHTQCAVGTAQRTRLNLNGFLEGFGLDNVARSLCQLLDGSITPRVLRDAGCCQYDCNDSHQAGRAHFVSE